AANLPPTSASSDHSVRQPLNPDAVSHYIRSVYELGVFNNVTVDRESGGGGNIILIYKVQERPMITDVKFVGMKAVRSDDDKVIAATKLHPGAILDPARVKETEVAIARVYADKGYPDVEVSYRGIPKPDNSEQAEFVVTEKPPVYVTKIDFTGNKAFSSSELRGQLDTTTHNFLSFVTHAGVLDPKKLQEDTERLIAFYGDHGYLNAHV